MFLYKPATGPLAEKIRRIPGLDLEKGPWVAGGAVRCLFKEIPLTKSQDIDVFLNLTENLNDELVTNLLMNGSNSIEYRKKFTDITNTENGNSTKYQIVKSRGYNTLKDLFLDFDFTVCHFATDGYTIAYTEESEFDVAHSHLRNTTGNVSRWTSANRILKYTKYGYRAVPGLLPWLIEIEKHTIDNNFQTETGNSGGY